MAKISLVAVHRIGYGKPNGDGTISYAEPGKLFEMDEAEANSLIASGAAKVAASSSDHVLDEKPAKKAQAKKAAAKKNPEPEPDTQATDYEAEGDDTDGGDIDLM